MPALSNARRPGQTALRCASIAPKNMLAALSIFLLWPTGSWSAARPRMRNWCGSAIRSWYFEGDGMTAKRILVVPIEKKIEALRMATGLTLLDDQVTVAVWGGMPAAHRAAGQCEAPELGKM